MAQFCFFKSIKLNENDAAGWTNLAVFYLLNINSHDKFLAHQCFKKAQAIDPEYPLAWTGQVIN